MYNYTVIIGNVTNNDESKYFDQVNWFVNWCQLNCFNPYVKKTMEMFLAFRKAKCYETLSLMNENAK